MIIRDQAQLPPAGSRQLGLDNCADGVGEGHLRLDPDQRAFHDGWQHSSPTVIVLSIQDAALDRLLPRAPWPPGSD